jgi:hypothetical protein
MTRYSGYIDLYLNTFKQIRLCTHIIKFWNNVYAYIRMYVCVRMNR